MKLRSRGRNPAKRYVKVNNTSLESHEAQIAAADPLIQELVRRLSRVESILSTPLGQAHESIGSILFDILSHWGKNGSLTWVQRMVNICLFIKKYQ